MKRSKACPLPRLVMMLFLALLCGAWPLVSCAHPNAALHHADLDLLLGGFKGSGLGEVAYEISDSIDSDLAKWFAEKYGKIPGHGKYGFGKHRMFSHGYTLGESIPREALEAIAKEYGDDAVTDVIGRQQEIASRYLKKLGEVTGLPRKQCRAFMRLFSNGHLLGDLMSDNSPKVTELIRDFDGISKSEMGAVEDLLGKVSPAYVKKLCREIEAIRTSSITIAEKAEQLTQLFGKLKVDVAVNRAYGEVFRKLAKPLSYGVNQAVNRNAKLAERIRHSKAARNIGVNSVKCNLREVKRGSKLLRAVDVPVITQNGVTEAAEVVARRSAESAKAVRQAFEASKGAMAKGAAKASATAAVTGTSMQGWRTIGEFLETPGGAAMTAGVLTFVIDESFAVAAYREGDLANDQFVQETVFNATKGAAIGVGTLAVTTLATGAGLPFVAVFAAEVGVCIVIEKGSEIVWAEVQKSYGVLPCVGLDELPCDLPPNVRGRSFWLDNLDEESIRDTVERNRSIFDATAPTSFEQDGRSFY